MANCPKCGYKLKFTDISQSCPKCGVNMRFYGFTENFVKEAKIAELSQAGVSCKVRRIKCAFIGSKLTIARLIVMLLPAAALLIPAANVSMTLPYHNGGFDFGILGFVSLFTGSDLSYIMTMAGSEFAGASFSALRTALIVFLAAAVFAVLVLLMSILCFISIKNMQKITAVTAVIGAAVCVVSFIFIQSAAKVCSGSPILSVKSGFGLFVVILAFAAVFVVNLLLVKKGIQVEYVEGTEERAAIWKKVKAGEINLDDLPQPVVETAETRKIQEEIEKEEKTYAEKTAAKGEDK